MPNKSRVTTKVLYGCGHPTTIECRLDEVLRERGRYQGRECLVCKANKALEMAPVWDFPPLKGEWEIDELRAAVCRQRIMRSLVEDAKRTFDKRTSGMTEEERERLRIALRTELRHMGQREKARVWLGESGMDMASLLDKVYGHADYCLRSYPPKTTAELKEEYDRLRYPRK